MKLIPFSLKLAQEGHPIQTRDGREAQFIAYIPMAINYDRVIYLCGGRIKTSDEDGHFYSEEDDLDLFMAPVKQEQWLNVYSTDGYHYPTKEEADRNARPSRIACIRIEYTEGEGLE